MLRARRLLLAGIAAACTLPALAQSAWPSKPVRIIHGFTAGGPVDALARLIAAQFAERFGQQAIVEGHKHTGSTNE